MKNWIILGIIGILICSSVTISATKNKIETQEIHETIYFSNPTISEQKTASNIILENCDSYSTTPGNYVLPELTKTYTFPAGTAINDVCVEFMDKNSVELLYAPQKGEVPVVDDLDATYSIPSYAFPLNQNSLDSQADRYNVHIVTGRYNDQLSTIVIVKIKPTYYDPETTDLSWYSEADISIKYASPKPIEPITEQVDLLIVAPDEFSNTLQQLVEHKNNSGLSTKLVTLSEIYQSTYFPVQGRDCAEEVKFFIKDAIENWGTSYVLFAGGRKGGIMQETWWVPVRYSHIDDGGEASFLTDLYFADIYDGTMNFSTWDSNENNVFAEWTGTKKDIIDMFPDVYVGRLACRNTIELRTMINKIILYETTAHGSSWVNKFVGVSGDTYPSAGDPYYEGELATEAAFNHLDGYSSSFLWTSDGSFSDKNDILGEVSKGCGFLHFSGHGSPAVWGNHPPHSKQFIYGPNNFEAVSLLNRGKNPIIIVGGCHNAQFNTSLLNIIKGVLTEGLDYFSSKNPLGSFWHDEWVPRCWGWSLVNKPWGGGIAIIANTGLGYGASGENWNQSRGRVMEMLFFEQFSQGHTILGATHGHDIMEYMVKFPPMDDLIDCKIAQQWVLLGDPTLTIGGFSS